MALGTLSSKRLTYYKEENETLNCRKLFDYKACDKPNTKLFVILQFIEKTSDDIKTKPNSCIPLETTAIFFFKRTFI